MCVCVCVLGGKEGGGGDGINSLTLLGKHVIFVNQDIPQLHECLTLCLSEALEFLIRSLFKPLVPCVH